MAHPMGESKEGGLRVDFDRRLKLEFHGSKVTSEAGLLSYRELDDAVELTEMAGDVLADGRTGKNGRHGEIGQLPQSVFGRLAGYDDVNDADRLGRDPAMRWIGGGHAIKGRAASTWTVPSARPTVISRARPTTATSAARATIPLDPLRGSSLFNQFGDLERCALRPGNVHSADDWESVLKPVVVRYKDRKVRLYFRGDTAFASLDM